MKHLFKTAAILLILAFVAAPLAQAGEAGDVNPKKGSRAVCELAPAEKL